MDKPGESIHYSVIVRDSSEAASALVDFLGEDIESASAVNVLLDPSFLIFSTDMDQPGSSARRMNVDATTIRNALPFYTNKEQLETFGTQLYNQLFGNEKLLVSFTSARQSGRVSSKPIRLCFENRDVARYSDLPWEALCHPGPPAVHLGDSQDINIVRTVRDLPDAEARQHGGAVRVLIVSASPDAANHVMVDEELLALKKYVEVRWPGLGKKDQAFKFKWLKPVRQSTKADFVDALDKFKPHIVHFIGHGSYENGVGYLHLHGSANPDEIVKVSAKDLVVMMKNRRPELIVLNSCEGAVGGTGNFSGIAESLLKTRCARFIVAMQYPISNAAAISFVEGFYPALQQGKSVDVAVSSGRNRIHMHEKQNVAVEFITPTLYMNGSDGRLFQTKPTSDDTGNKRPAWLVPVLATVVILALIAAGTLMFLFKGESTPGEIEPPPNPLVNIQINIGDGDTSRALEEANSVIDKCSREECDPGVEVDAREAAELLTLIKQASTEAGEGDLTAVLETLRELETRSSQSWLKDELAFSRESGQIMEEQAEAEVALQSGEWRAAERRFSDVSEALNGASGAAVSQVDNLIDLLRQQAESGRAFTQARIDARYFVNQKEWRMAKEKLKAAAAARPDQAGSESAVLADSLLDTVIEADALYESGQYAAARRLYLSVVDTGRSLDPDSDWAPIVAHAKQTAQLIDVLQPASVQIEPTEPEPGTGIIEPPALNDVMALEMGQTLVPFKTNSAQPGPAARSQIAAAAQQFRALGNSLDIRVIGRADARGSDAYNQALALRRAEAVVAALAAEGVSTSAMTSTSVGESWALPVQAFSRQDSSQPGSSDRLARDRSALIQMGHPGLSSANFAFDSARLGPGDASELEVLAAWLRDNPQVHVSVVGHTDAVGSLAYNERLGQRRATAVAEALVARSVSSSRIQTHSAGESRPLVSSGATREARRINRRAVITLYVPPNDAAAGGRP